MYKQHIQMYETDNQHEILKHWIDTNFLYNSCGNLNKSIAIQFEFLEKPTKNQEEAVQYAKLKHETETIAIPFMHNERVGYVVIGWVFEC
jgi:hypothetical protein